MKRLQALIQKYIFSEELSLDARMINMVLCVGMAAALVASISRIIVWSGIVLVTVMISITLSVAVMIYVINRFRFYYIATWVFLIFLCDILLPVALFALSGSDGGMTAYFVLSIVAIFFLTKKKSRVILLVTHISWVIACYAVAYRFPSLVSRQSELYRTFDNVQAFLVSGFFIGFVVLFQNRIYNIEKIKATKSNEKLVKQDILLRSVNNAATILLESDMDSLEESLSKGMAGIAEHITIDRMNIWKNGMIESDLRYIRVYEWVKNSTFHDSRLTDFSYRGTFPNWLDTLSTGGSINGALNTLPLTEQTFLKGYGVKSILVIPVFLQGSFWGFVSFDDLTFEHFFPAEEENMLRSASLLMVNAFVRNEMTQGLVQAREEAISSASAKSNFLANMSHEIRTPMNAIIGMTAIAKSSEDPERKGNCLDKIEDASNHLLGILNDILDMSKIEANKLELSSVAFDFEKTLQRVVNIINFRMDKKKLHFTVRIDSHIPRTLEGDDQRLAQVITNLLGNAIKFTPECGSVRLNAYLVSEENDVCTIRVEVNDTGIGISEEQQSRLFHSFAQADNTTSRVFGGTGLGLAISKNIVEMMNGRIWVESELGKGSNFIFTIQMKRIGKDETQHSLLGPDVNWDNIKILIVDDAPETLELFGEIAQNLGIACDKASGGEDALSLIDKNGAYDIYFIDWNMPIINGVELSRRIKAKALGSESSVVTMISATDWNLIEKDAKEAGVDRFLPKPLFSSAVVDCINECLGMDKLVSAKRDETNITDIFKGYRALLAEDVAINQEIVLAILEPTLLEIDCAENGAEAVRMYREAPEAYDIILMDVQMPKMDGLTATRKIRALEGVSAALSVPIIAMTANAFREDIEKCLESGMNDHVSKPLDFGEVFAKLRKYLR